MQTIIKYRVFFVLYFVLFSIFVGVRLAFIQLPSLWIIVLVSALYESQTLDLCLLQT